MALKYNCFVTAGYPEKVDSPTPEYYNSAVTVGRDGETIANYRKSFLYDTDEIWAQEGNGFYEGAIPELGKVAMGNGKCTPTHYQHNTNTLPLGMDIKYVSASPVHVKPY